MPKHISTVRGRLGLALAAALVAGSVGLPASAPAAPAPQQPAQFSCNPSFENCMTLYRYYSSSSYATQVGGATRDCDGVYTLDWGYTTQWVKVDYIHCPY